MKPAGLRRTLLLWVARWLKAWVEGLLRQEDPAPAPAAERGPPPAPMEDGPPAHWVEKVRKAAPELLMGLDARHTRRPAQPIWVTQTARHTPPGAEVADIPWWGERQQRREEPEGSRAPRSPSMPPVDPAPAPSPRPGRPQALEVPWPDPPEPQPPHLTAVPAPPPVARIGPARRTNRVTHRPTVVPPPAPDLPRPLGAPAVPWPRLQTSEAPAPAGARPSEPNPWPELPEEDPGEELEDSLLRRLERLHRIAREQRGE